MGPTVVHGERKAGFVQVEWNDHGPVDLSIAVMDCHTISWHPSRFVEVFGGQGRLSQTPCI